MEFGQNFQKAYRYFAVYRWFPLDPPAESREEGPHSEGGVALDSPSQSPLATFPDAKASQVTRQALAYFPAFALGVGFSVAVLDNVFQLFQPLPVASALTVTYLIVVSGGRNLKGLASTAEGFFSSPIRDRTLELMRDPRISLTGVLAVLSVLMLKFTTLMSLKSNEQQPWVRWGVLLLVPLCGKVALLHLLRRLPSARKEGSFSTFFQGETRNLPLALGYGAILVLGFFFMGSRGFFVAVSVPLFIEAYGRYCQRRLGGFTVEILAAACELTETVALLVVTTLRN